MYLEDLHHQHRKRQQQAFAVPASAESKVEESVVTTGEVDYVGDSSTQEPQDQSDTEGRAFSNIDSAVSEHWRINEENDEEEDEQDGLGDGPTEPAKTDPFARLASVTNLLPNLLKLHQHSGSAEKHQHESERPNTTNEVASVKSNEKFEDEFSGSFRTAPEPLALGNHPEKTESLKV
eukprot:CAMPEP_0116866034 /NCGR_PEP_ID=MMETSP0418-20121206/25798_1 /TAXON_ID=1158023 /ORGANISM="Astrosyne radiata, Strain 13vi08-1A" /LENGTH=177 /DNA_ID=CAMNT_0004501611 /DNA_START=193 /DNA_END=726 /DNA_ORIENTATION=+